MNPQTVVDKLSEKYKSLIWNSYPLPKAYIGNDHIKAIILGADPTHIVNQVPVQITKVFDLDNPNSPYWRGISRNMQMINGLSINNVHVENVCKNYFTTETSKNKYWVEIARENWIPFLKEELDKRYSSEVPVLITTEFILNAITIESKTTIPASTIYKECLVIKGELNLLNRDIIAFYRHPYYSLKRWPEYSKFISNRLSK